MVSTGGLRCSLVVPVYDEADNVEPLLAEIAQALAPLGQFEVIVVDDGSRDPSFARLQEFKRRHQASWLRLLRLRAHRGQSAAVMAGVEAASAALVCVMDGDRQNDPLDLPAMLARLEHDDCDAVVGYRPHRQDSWLRRVSSRWGNAVRNWLTGDRVRDSACGIKAARRTLWLAVPRFTGMHRFMPTLLRWSGGRVVEMQVTHRPRVAGKSKYGVRNRAARGLLDCLAVRWYRRRLLDYAIGEEA